jgi:hypothetical protein
MKKGEYYGSYKHLMIRVLRVYEENGATKCDFEIIDNKHQDGNLGWVKGSIQTGYHATAITKALELNPGLNSELWKAINDSTK